MIVRTFVLLTAVVTGMWAAEPIAGDWAGTLKPGNAELRLIVHVKSSDGKLSATVDSVDQGVKGIPVDTITFADQMLKYGSELYGTWVPRNRTCG